MRRRIREYPNCLNAIIPSIMVTSDILLYSSHDNTLSSYSTKRMHVYFYRQVYWS